jgi:annexin A7/11
MKGFGTNENALIAILSKPDPLRMALIRNTFNQRHRRDLEKDIKSETSGYFRDGLISLVRGPLMADVHNIKGAVKGLGTKESLLSDILVGRTNADINAIKQAYQREHHTSLESDVGGDLSLKTKELFDMIMAAKRAEESAPVLPHEVERDVGDLYAATLARTMGSDQMLVSRILTSRSNNQIRAIAHQFQQRFSQTLETAIDKHIKDHMKDALLLLVRRAIDRVMADAEQLEDAMAGIGTKDVLLVSRVIRVHWDRAHMDQVKCAYQQRYQRDLIARVRGETSGNYHRLMMACLT